MGSTTLKIALFVIAIASGTFFFYANSGSTEPDLGSTLVSKTASNTNQTTTKIAMQTQPAPQFQWDESDDLPANDSPPAAPNSNFTFGDDEDDLDADAFSDSDSEMEATAEDSFSDTDSSSLDESSFENSENTEPPAAPQPDRESTGENFLPDNEVTPAQDTEWENNSLENDSLENNSFENDSLENDSLENKLTESDSMENKLTESGTYTPDKLDDEASSFVTNDIPEETNQLNDAPAETSLAEDMIDTGDTTDLNSDQFSNTANSDLDRADNPYETATELLEEPRNAAQTPQPTKADTAGLQHGSQTNDSLQPGTSLPNEFAEIEAVQSLSLIHI